ncbi:MAG: NADH-quinone oxidoreductase subunit L [Phycisphaerae bacterium]|nr:NADH-quinone oxidoreductase subunit L [Phycisphaerae bacterium]
MDLKTLAILIPLLPLVGAALVGVVGLRWLRDRSHWLVLGGVGLALVAAFWLFRIVAATPGEPDPLGGRAGFVETLTVYQWISAGVGSWLNVTYWVDPLTSVMLLTVVGISFVIVAYSVGYMRDHHGQAERGYERFFAYMGIFVFSMTTLVLAGNFLLLYLGWELVGLSSYLLIGFYYQRPAAAAAAKKAFLVNRIGDFGFGLGIFLIYLTFNTLDYGAVFKAVSAAMAHDQSGLISALGLAPGADVSALMATIESRVTAIALLLFCGAVGKSAQLPLHVWLPDAMEGPTPVSALIHAATMVTAGVYMVARCCVIFSASPIAMHLVAYIGAATAFFAATIALTQFDMKRILAYSTLSQLGYMFLGLGVGAFDSAIFHLYTHAFFKALLFLAAGSVMHAMGGVIDMRRFGGLAKGMKITAATFWVGGLALAGCPLLAGFWSKDEIIHAAIGSHLWWLGVIGLVTALLTAFYTFRMIFVAFHGELKLPRGVDHAVESGTWMAVPLVILAIGAAFAGYVNVALHGGGFLGVFEPHGGFREFLKPVFAEVMTMSHGAHGAAQAHAGGGHALMYISSVIAFCGIGTAWFFYRRRPTIPGAIALWGAPIYRLLYNKYYVDEAYDLVFVRPLRRFGDFCHGVDRYFINGILWLIAAVPRAIGFGLKGWQQGATQGYALAMVVGLLAIILWVLIRSAA